MAIFSKPNKPLLPAADADLVVQAIQQAERMTSGELRVYIESYCTYVDAADRAWEVFRQLQMEQTRERNAVLIYLALKDRQMAIIADEGIHRRVGQEPYWKKEIQVLRSFCSEGRIAEGLAEIIGDIGAALAQYFPASATDNKNEIPDDIVFGH